MNHTRDGDVLDKFNMTGKSKTALHSRSSCSMTQRPTSTGDLSNQEAAALPTSKNSCTNCSIARHLRRSVLQPNANSDTIWGSYVSSSLQPFRFMPTATVC